MTVVLACALLFCGCVEQKARHRAYQLPEHKSYSVEVISDPPGARIEVNNDFIGEAPCIISLPGWGDRKSYQQHVIIRAIPKTAGQYTQTKFISQGDPIPHKILFAMNLGPATPQIDVNVNE